MDANIIFSDEERETFHELTGKLKFFWCMIPEQTEDVESVADQ